LASVGDLVRSVITAGGYPGLTALILLENIFPPVPSELVLPLAGYYVGEGEFNFLLAVAAATAGSVIGAFVLYTIARRGGRALLLRHGRVFRIKDSDLDRADDWFDRYGGWLVLVGRLVPGVRSLVSVPAGVSEMPRVRFALLTALGSAVWNAALVGLGVALGRNYTEVADFLGPVGTGITVALILGGVAFAVWWFRRRSPA